MLHGRERAEFLREVAGLDHHLVAHGRLLFCGTVRNVTSAAMPARSVSEPAGKRTLTANTCFERSATVCVLRGVNSAIRLICSTSPSNSRFGNASTLTPTLIWPSHG